MPKERFFLEQTLKTDDTIKIEEKEFHHLVNVCRAKVNDSIEIVNGMGDLALGNIISIEKRHATVLIEKVTHELPESFQIILAQSIPRPGRLDFILEKATELGVTEIWLFAGDTSERKDLKETQLERMKTILISALKQCGRLYLPKLLLKPALEKWKPLEYPSFFGDVEKTALPFLASWKRQKEDKGIIFFIGSETGFSAPETKLLRNMQATGVKLNANILRTDTAAIAALTLICHA